VNPKKIVTRWLLADLNPPLGYPGGSCYFQERVRKEVKNPKQQDAIIDQHQEEGKIKIQDELLVYKEHSEGGVPGTPFKEVTLSAHAQHRMDLRGVTVPEIKQALREFSDVWQKAKSQSPPGVDDIYTRNFRKDRNFVWSAQSTGMELRMTVLRFQEADKKRGTKAELEVRVDTLFWNRGPEVKIIPEKECESWEGWSKEYPEHGLGRNFPKIVAARWVAKMADLNPPLGYPGGPCQVLERIRDEVPNTNLQNVLVDTVEEGTDLSNSDASKVYSAISEQGISGSVIQKIHFSVHAQYRMDLRHITIPEVRASLKNFLKAWQREKSMKSPLGKQWETMMIYNEGIRWVDPKMGLSTVFELRDGTAYVITAFLSKYSKTPSIDESSCEYDKPLPAESVFRTALKMGPEPGVQTLVNNKSQDNLPTDIDREQEVNLPLPGAATPGGGGRDIPQFSFNTPDSDWGIADRPRTLGVPGGDQYDSPTKFDYGMPTRRLLASRVVTWWVSKGNG